MTTEQIRTRIAPSPTGLLHIGNIRAGLYNWLFAKKNGGSYMLRIDDTDRVRSKPEYEEAIRQDMTWLGLSWDRTARESDRMDVYLDMIEKLKATGRVYACYETQEELGLKRKAALAQGMPPVYDRFALSMSDEQKAAYEAEGRKPHWRFKLDWDKPIVWDDQIQGHKEFNAKTMSDPVVIREDGVPLFTFCGMVDDVMDDTTHIIRGEDHVSNTAVQIQIGEAIAPLMGKVLNAKFAHFPLLVSATGEEMSKRLGTMSIREMREEMGLEAMAITSLLARLGTSLPMEPALSLDELAGTFDLSTISRNPPKLDVEDLKRLNAKILHMTPFETVAERLAALGVGGGAEFWHAIRGIIHTLAEAKDWYDVISGQISPQIPDAEFAKEAAALLPAEPWDNKTFSAWAAQIKEKTGKSGKNLFMPLRLALTAREHGPELGEVLPLMGRARVLARLEGKAA